MDKPYKYFVLENKNKTTLFECDYFPSYHAHSPEKYTVWEDTRYEAKLRLYNYVTYTEQGKEIPTYKPYEGTEIGKNEPILNF